MPEKFIRFSELLRAPARERIVEHVRIVESTPAPGKSSPDEVEVAREIVHFRAHLAEAFDRACEVLIERFARELLGRELQVAPVDITAIVQEVRRAFSSEEPLCVRVNPQDALNLCADIPIRPDSRLSPGDAIVEVRNGDLDASLAIRFESLLQAVSAR